jgi:hypothetical protein
VPCDDIRKGSEWRALRRLPRIRLPNQKEKDKRNSNVDDDVRTTSPRNRKKNHQNRRTKSTHRFDSG